MKTAHPIFILIIFLIVACSKKQAESASYLTNGGEFQSRSEAANAPDATVARFVLWLTDTTAVKEKPAGLSTSMNADDLDYVKKYFSAVKGPKRGDIIAASGGASVIAFSGADTLMYPGGHFWLMVKTSANTITAADVYTEPETFDAIEMITSASKRMQEILAASGGREMHSGNETLHQLSPPLFPDLNAVKTALREFFTAKATEAIVSKLGMKTVDGSVWTAASAARESRSWNDARIAAITRDANGFVLTLAVPVDDFQRTTTATVPFVMTLEGWKIDGEF